MIILHMTCSEMSSWKRRSWHAGFSIDKLVSWPHDWLESKVIRSQGTRSKVAFATEAWHRCAVTGSAWRNVRAWHAPALSWRRHDILRVTHCVAK